jgi:hypothetical protein
MKPAYQSALRFMKTPLLATLALVGIAFALVAELTTSS